MVLKFNGLPEGMAFYLPNKAKSLNNLVQQGSSILEDWGYQPVYVPALLPYNMVSSGVAEEKVKNYYKLIDFQGDILVLRPEMTSAIAGLVARERGNLEFPARFFYYSSVYRHETTQSGKDREIYQLGAERFGGSKTADIEMLTLVQKIIMNSGLKDYHLELGHIGFLEYLFDSLNLEEELIASLKAKLASRDLVGYRNLTKNLDSDTSERLLKLLELRGGPEVLTEAGKIIPDESSQSLSHLNDIYEALESIGLADQVNFDLALMRNLDYYTGIVFEVMTSNLGYNISGGGRYDKLLSKFGVDSIPAVGFAIGIDRLRLAIEKSQEFETNYGIIKICVKDNTMLKQAYNLAEGLQGENIQVALDYSEEVDLVGQKEKVIIVQAGADYNYQVRSNQETSKFVEINEVIAYVKNEFEGSPS